MAQFLPLTVKRCEPVLITPAEATPYEFKELSDIDDQDGLRLHLPNYFFYRSNEHFLSKGHDPVKVIREALAKALMVYYPFAGRLFEGPERKLIVECNSKGVLFVEADADVSLDQFGDELPPPFPCLQELLFDVDGSNGILDSPLLLIQVTRLTCGGFVFALRLNHTMADAPGLVLFMNAVAEMARGCKRPTVHPVWKRELLRARIPPNPTCTHHEFDYIPDTDHQHHDEVHKSFFFGPKRLSSLRKMIPRHMHASTFELLTAYLWKTRTIALCPDPDDVSRITCIVSVRDKLADLPLPAGYYGNAFAFSATGSKVRDLCKNPFGYALGLVQKTKAAVDEEYVRSSMDVLATKGRLHFTMAKSFMVSDVTKVGFDNVDFGWGRAVYGGPAVGGTRASFYVSYNDGIVVPICLPSYAMSRLESLFQRLDDECDRTVAIKPGRYISSAI